MRMDMGFATFSHMHITFKKCGLKKLWLSVVINIIITLKLALLDKLNLLLILSVLRFKIPQTQKTENSFAPHLHNLHNMLAPDRHLRTSP